MENLRMGVVNIPELDEDNSANYIVESNQILSTEINYYPAGLIEFDLTTNHFDNNEIKEIAAPNRSVYVIGAPHRENFLAKEDS